MCGELLPFWGADARRVAYPLAARRAAGGQLERATRLPACRES